MSETLSYYLISANKSRLSKNKCEDASHGSLRRHASSESLGLSSSDNLVLRGTAAASVAKARRLGGVAAKLGRWTKVTLVGAMVCVALTRLVPAVARARSKDALGFSHNQTAVVSAAAAVAESESGGVDVADWLGKRLEGLRGCHMEALRCVCPEDAPAAVVAEVEPACRRRRVWKVAAARSAPLEGLVTSAQLLRRSRGPRHQLRNEAFLRGVEALMPAFEAFGGLIHAAAVKDVAGNVRKLRRNGADTVPLHRLVQLDALALNATHPDSSAQALVWLSRVLRFTATFFENLVTDQHRPLTDCLTAAYERELGPHHNVLMRSLAYVLMHVIPDRSAMLRCFQVATFAHVQPHLTHWADTVKPLVAHIDALYLGLGIETNSLAARSR